MRFRLPPAAQRYGLAVVSVLLAIGLRRSLDTYLGERFRFAFLYLAVLVAARYGGFGPAVTATALGMALSAWHLLPSRDPFVFAGFAVYAVVGAGIAWLGETMRAANRRVEEKMAEQQRALHALRLSEERFARFMQHLPGLAWIKDARGRYLYANDAAVRAFGVPCAKLYGKTDDEVFPPATAAQFKENDRRALAGAGVQAVETLRHPDGVVHHSLVAKFSIPDPAGTGPLVGGMAIDVTRQKRTEDELRHRAEEMEKLMDLVPMGVFIAHDPACRLITGNRAGYEMMRLPSGVNLSVTPPPGSTAPFALLREGKELSTEQLPMQYAAAHGVEVRNAELEHVHPDGAAFTMYGSAAPLFDAAGKVRGCVAAFLDITERKRIEGQLRDADRRKDEFLATLAHELRNPLAPLRNGLELLRRADGDGQRIAEARTVMERQLEQLVHLVDDLLDVSRITRGKVQLRKERVNLADAVRGAVETTRPLIEASAHKLTVTLPAEPLYLDADRTRLAQVFSNLLHNAAKYTEPGGHVWLTAERDGGQVVVSVRDTGIGIAAEHLPRLFEMFSQAAPALERSHGGLGIGLSLVRGLVELHGGRVEAQSGGPGKGSEFTVRLPAVEAPAPPATAAPEKKPEGGPKCRILVADDNRDAVRSLALLLRMMGHEVHTAHDGLEAVQAAATFRPDAALLDIGMPKMNGYEAARSIREQPWGRNTVLVAVTGWGQEEDKRRAREVGFNEHMTKPVDPVELEKLVCALVAGAK
jgi:PAS domain S-box-containing protein